MHSGGETGAGWPARGRGGPPARNNAREGLPVLFCAVALQVVPGTPGDLGIAPLLALAIAVCLGAVALGVRGLLVRSQHLRRRSDEEQQRALFLAEASQLFASSLNLEETLQTAVGKATEVLGDECLILLLEGDPPALRLAWAADAGPDRGAGQQEPSFARGLAGDVASTGQPLLVPNWPHSVYGGIGARGLSDRDSSRIRSALAVPLRVESRVTGVLVSAYGRKTRVPGEDDLRLAGLLADRAAIAIEHARLHRHLEELVEARTAELHETHRRLLEAERAKAIAELAGVVAHEIRNPLNILRTATFSLAEGMKGQDARLDRQLLTLERSVESAARIIQDLMDYGVFPRPEFTETGPGQLAREVASHIPIPEDVEFSVEIGPHLPTIRCDVGQVGRAITNLLLNALQSLDGPGSVRLCVEAVDDSVVFEVRDTGRGVPEAVRPHIFDPLFSTKVKGTGLGLTLTRRIFEENGGGIAFESSEGAGSAFRAWLPAVTTEAADPGEIEGEDEAVEGIAGAQDQS